MKNKITLITPPDFYENDSFSLFFIGLQNSEQEILTSFLSDTVYGNEINIYFHVDEKNSNWLLYSLAKSDLVFINVNNVKSSAEIFLSYILSKPNVYFITESEDLGNQFKIINSNRIPDFNFFLQEVLNKELTKRANND